jgi:hypothetical protein
MPTGEPIKQVGRVKVGEEFSFTGYERAEGRVREIRPYTGKFVEYFTHIVTLDNKGATPSGETIICIKESDYQ